MDYLGIFSDIASAQRAVRSALADASNGEVNLVTQGHEVHWIPPMMAIQVRCLEFGDTAVYGVGAGKFTLGRDALETLAQAARLDTLSSQRVDHGTEPYLCTFDVTVKIPLLAGGYTTAIGNKTEDLRDGSPAAKAALGRSGSKASLDAARQFVAERCATKARLRAYRQAMKIGAMAKAQARRPWIVIALVPHFDASMVSQSVVDAAAARLLGVDDLMYGGGAQHVEAPRQLPPVAVEPPPAQPAPDLILDAEPPPAADTATPSQLKALAGFFHHLGRDVFEAEGERALGFKTPHSSQLTAAQAEALLASFEAADRVEF